MSSMSQHSSLCQASNEVLRFVLDLDVTPNSFLRFVAKKSWEKKPFLTISSVRIYHNVI